MRLLLATFAMTLFSATASADSLWTYMGNSMAGCNCALMGAVDFTNPVAVDTATSVLSYSFTDGTHTLNNLNSIAQFDPFITSTIPFDGWIVNIRGNGILLQTEDAGSPSEATDSVYFTNDTAFGTETGRRGTWTEVIQTPEPGTLTLVGIGLGAFLGRKRLKGRQAMS